MLETNIKVVFCKKPSNLPCRDEHLPAGVHLVYPNDPIGWKRAVDAQARYYKCEFNDMHQMYYAHNHVKSSNELKVFVFRDYCLEQDQIDTTKAAIVGAAMFGLMNYKNLGETWLFHWIYFHPIHRNRGYFKKYWNFFREELGEFVMERPFSPAMQLFLMKSGAPHPVMQNRLDNERKILSSGNLDEINSIDWRSV